MFQERWATIANPEHRPAEQLRQLVDARLDQLPQPGQGHTLARWQALATIAAHDLTLAKLFEGHTDALAILAELGATTPVPAGSTWGVWCAEPPDARVILVRENGGRVRLSGTKAWCSGANDVSHALVSCWDAEGRQCLAALAMGQPGVVVTHEGWHAVGMAATASVDVRLSSALAHEVGRPGDYTSRPGFWWGGAGIAACWWGGASAIAGQLLVGGKPGDAHRQAHLGAIDVSLRTTAALLREAAAVIDDRSQHDRTDFQSLALRVRLAAEATATEVVARAGRALGAAPLCRDASFARRMADLPVFIRQSHAERDLAALGQALMGAAPWTL